MHDSTEKGTCLFPGMALSLIGEMDSAGDVISAERRAGIWAEDSANQVEGRKFNRKLVRECLQEGSVWRDFGTQGCPVSGQELAGHR